MATGQIDVAAPQIGEDPMNNWREAVANQHTMLGLAEGMQSLRTDAPDEASLKT
jgi:hypothetical protein